MIYPMYVAAVLFSLVAYASGADALATAAPDVVFARPHGWDVIGNLLMLQNLILRPIASDILAPARKRRSGKPVTKPDSVR